MAGAVARAVRLGAGVGALAIAGAAAAIAASRLWIRTSAAGRMYDAAMAPRREVALVLGAGLRADGTPTPYLAARLDLAGALYARGAVRTVLVSGECRGPEYDEPAAMRAYLSGAGVPMDRSVMDGGGRDTYDSCYRAAAVFGVRSLAVVSQSYHVPRALAVCRALRLDAVGVGDESGRARTATWAAGERREAFAGVKAAWDVTSRRVPPLDPPLDLPRRPVGATSG